MATGCMKHCNKGSGLDIVALVREIVHANSASNPTIFGCQWRVLP